MNSEIRTVIFNQGVGVALPPIGDVGGKVSLNNNAANIISALGYDYLVVMCAVVEYYIYRRTDSGFKWMKGKVSLVGVPDGATNALKWDLVQDERTEINESGITFSLTETDARKSTLTATLDNMVGANHSCTMYYKVNAMLA